MKINKFNLLTYQKQLAFLELVLLILEVNKQEWVTVNSTSLLDEQGYEYLYMVLLQISGDDYGLYLADIASAFGYILSRKKGDDFLIDVKILDKNKIVNSYNKLLLKTRDGIELSGNSNIETIKHAHLDDEKHTLTIDHGRKIIPFRSPRSKTKEQTKIFKILFVLWGFREESQGKKTVKKGEFVPSSNLRRLSGCPSNEAVYKHIKRLNTVFKKNNVFIKIETKKNDYMLFELKSKKGR